MKPHSLQDRRRDAADAVYQAYDFGKYEVEEAAGWSYISTTGKTEYTITVYVVPPLNNGHPGIVGDHASVSCVFTVTFAADSAIPETISATINGETIGEPGIVVLTADDEAISMADALSAIIARVDGVFDHPALMKFGPLSVDTTADIVRIAKAGLIQASAE